ARVTELLTLIQRVTERVVSATVDIDEHHALARRAAAESAVLLRNEGGILPLAPETSVALIGDFVRTPRFQGAGSSLVSPTRVTSLAEAAPAAGMNIVGIADGFRRDAAPDAQLRAEAVALATRADVVVLALGLPEISESE